MNKPAYTPGPAWRNLLPFRGMPRAHDTHFTPAYKHVGEQPFILDTQLTPQQHFGAQAREQ